MIFDYMGIRLNGPKADGKTLLLNWNFTDVNAKYVLTLENCALTYVAGKQVPDADATITLTRAGFDAITLGHTTIEDEIQAGRITILGDTLSLAKFFSLLDVFTGDFNIVTP
jgi:alkyl sulfatase BDS1-like metallo-beta-lactamase superfamily hydrolase